MLNPLRDIRYALRQLRRSPGFAATAVLTLALGLGATTAIFTLVYQVMLRPLPVAHPEQLYKVGKELQCCVDGGLQGDWGIFSYDLYRYLRDQTPGTAGVIAVQAGTNTVSVRRPGNTGAVQPWDLRFVSGNYFPVLGVKPYAGRLLRPEDDREGAAPVAVVSYTYWRTKLAGDPHLVGGTLLLTGHPYTVVGIAAPDFLGERIEPGPPGLWVPLWQEPILNSERKLMRSPGALWLDLMVRVPNSKQAPAIGQVMQGELRQWIGAHPNALSRSMETKDIPRQTTEIVPASGGINVLSADYGSSLKLLQWVAGFVLLIACANLANLLLVRGMGRKQELVVRSALGAPRSRLVRQTLTEALLLALGGGAAALAVAYGGARAILALAMKGVDVSPLAAAPSLPVLGFAFAASLVTGVLFGFAPAWITSRANPAEVLRGANRSTRDASALPQKLLVVLQAALSLTLLSTAGLLITSLRHLEQQNFHFEPEGRLLLFLDLQGSGIAYPQLAGLYRRMDDTFTRLPGIESFAYATYAPMAYDNWMTGVAIPGADPNTGHTASYTAVSSHYFETVGTRLLLGRGIIEQDTPTSAHVAVVNRTFAEKYLKGKPPIGEHFGPDSRIPDEFTIVGVVDDTIYGDPAEPTRPMFFTPMAQATTYKETGDIEVENFKHFATNLVFHYRGDETAAAASIRAALKGIDPNIPILRMRSYTDELSDNFTQQELVVRLTTLFGLLALVLASIGLYGVTAYAVARRTSEIGIRMALGASRGGVLRMVVRGALRQTLLGLAIGLPLCFGAARMVRSGLYQTGGFQPLVLAAVASLLLLSALVAALVPARRAASIEPIEALRTE